MNADDALEYVG